jgi:hypothetical protein
LESIIDIIASRNIVNICRNSEIIFAFIEKLGKTKISLAILLIVIGTHSSPIIIMSAIIVGHKIEIWSGLDNILYTFL